MKKQDIRNAYTQKVTELLNQGYTIFPDTMNGSQGEIAHIDLTNGSEILRVLLTREHRWERGEGGYTGDTILLTVAGPHRTHGCLTTGMARFGTAASSHSSKSSGLGLAGTATTTGTPTWRKAAGSAACSGNATRHSRPSAGRSWATLSNQQP